MPQFILNTPGYRKPPRAFYSLDDFAKGYVEAMFFTNGDTGDDDEFRLNDMGVERLTKAAVETIRRDCDRFQADNRELLDEALDQARIDGYDEASAGRDFWFTRQGHGVGFWDRKELDANDLGDRLSEAAKRFGESYVEVWRGWIHVR